MNKDLENNELESLLRFSRPLYRENGIRIINVKYPKRNQVLELLDRGDYKVLKITNHIESFRIIFKKNE